MPKLRFTSTSKREEEASLRRCHLIRTRSDRLESWKMGWLELFRVMQLTPKTLNDQTDHTIRCSIRKKRPI
jgi:hypothetical protein